MKILVVSHAAGPYGAERVGVALARGLSRRGHDVVMDFPHPGPAVETLEAASAPVRASDVPGPAVRVGGRHRLPRRAAEVPGWLAGAPAAFLDVRRAVREVDPDLVWVNSLYNPWAALAAGLGRRPVVWHLHEYRLPEPLGLKAAALVGVVATRVAVVSGFLADGWRRYPWLRRRMDVLPNPLLDPPAAAPRDEPDGPFTVGYVGQLEPRKRAPDLVRAVGMLPETRAVLVGDGKARADVEAVIRDADVVDRVELAGFREDVYAQLARFHCLAIPSLREPFGLVALEAMAAGVPVVAARSGALPEVLDDAAVFHRPGDPADLAAAIDRLRTDRTLRRELVARGFTRVKAYDENAWLDAAEDIAHRAVGQRVRIRETGAR